MGGTDRPPADVLMSQWRAQAIENIEKWGLQDEETLLLAMQEELGELTQAVLEAREEDGDPRRIGEELDDLGPLLIQLHKALKNRADGTATDQGGDD
jgi:NTP pyrophosphatase (non-canonical NTP hydrolase)